MEEKLRESDKSLKHEFNQFTYPVSCFCLAACAGSISHTRGSRFNAIFYKLLSVNSPNLMKTLRESQLIETANLMKTLRESQLIETATD